MKIYKGIILLNKKKTSILEKTCDEVGYDAYIRYQEGYDHSYFFIASFIGEHIAFHNQFLKAD